MWLQGGDGKVLDPEKAVSLEVQGLAKSYAADGRRIDVLTGVSCTIYRNEVVAVIGASGVGKTTLLHIIGTLDRPSAGKVLYGGMDVFSWSDSRLSSFRNSEIGFVFQFHHLLPEFTALENVMMPCLLAGMARSQARQEATALLEELDLAERMDLPSSRLSGGEQQRVALARAVIRNPKLILADEPTGNLDEKSGRKVAELLFSMKERPDTSVILVTHNLSLACRADRVIGLRDGIAVELEMGELADFVMKKAA